MEERITRLEEQVAHLTRVTEDLSDVIARQEAEITRLTRRMSMLMEREAERELQEGGTRAAGRPEATALVNGLVPGIRGHEPGEWVR